MDSAISIRSAGEADFDTLTDVWERAARPTHPFLDDEHLADLRPRIRDLLLPSMDVWLAAIDGRPVGFVGARDDHVELLYIDPEAQGRGVGPALLTRVANGAGPRSVEVYAGNAVGLGFYRSQGFGETRRDPTDVVGRAFAIVHLERQEPT
ncbi:GNAT family N-acetyltransferase [Aeromicrobium sp. A1-2]|uniref:GNAT family N-acetyltransferase n=1 Tax=Aeromicrobium sp. A1-2 TaxID=2107713 RepID=UPI000E4D046B|nr:GNAT family N-acetyltransferase [Aeromicrobium sp. A1-2]AXT84074.1 GNAT family N-acetyltransferase [Aeromicrobium sp. A1-2]